jgi:CheY-like chemotaxis protein
LPLPSSGVTIGTRAAAHGHVLSEDRHVTVLPIADSAWTIVPSALWVALVAGIVFAYRKQIAQLLPRIESVKIGPFEASLAAAAEARGQPVSDDVRGRLARRAARDAPAIRGARILWVDNDPERNAFEMQTLRSLGMTVATVRSTDAALELLAREEFDAVVSDIKRSNGDSGRETERRVHEHYAWLPLVFYVTDLEPGVPKGAHGITNRPDELVHLVIDVLERRRG